MNAPVAAHLRGMRPTLTARKAIQCLEETQTFGSGLGRKHYGTNEYSQSIIIRIGAILYTNIII